MVGEWGTIDLQPGTMRRCSEGGERWRQLTCKIGYGDNAEEVGGDS